ncbi:MAG: four helix bundle protein [Phycisphaerae bacterium]|nr:four helix bundle protein [Tepidisphaeraceae bacterium]
MQVQRFEDLIAWQKARALTRSICQLTSVIPFARDFGLKDQIQRAAVSTMSNVAEGFERNRLTEFHQFLSIAKSSCAETRSLLYVALDARYIIEPVFREHLLMGEEVGRIIGGLRSSVEREMKA